MTLSQQVVAEWDRDGAGLAWQLTLTDTGELAVSDYVSAGTEGYDYVCIPSVDVANITLLFIVSDQDVTVGINDSVDGTPDDVFSLAAGVPFYWYKGCGVDLTDLLTIVGVGNLAIETLYFKNETSDDANIEVRCLFTSYPA